MGHEKAKGTSVTPANAHLSKQDLDHFKKRLTEARAEVVDNWSVLTEETLRQHDAGDLSHWPVEQADAGAEENERDRSLEVLESERRLVQEIDAAMHRMEDATYGICEATGKPIPKSRLEAVPWARYTLEAAEAKER